MTFKEVEDIIECIVKYDDTASIEEKGIYFEVIQKDLRKLTTVNNEVSVCGLTDLEHNKSIFNLGQCHSCFSNKIVLPLKEGKVKSQTKEYKNTLPPKSPPRPTSNICDKDNCPFKALIDEWDDTPNDIWNNIK